MTRRAGVLVVFTAKSVDQILEAGGTQSWVLNKLSMRDVEYVVCTRNSAPESDEECGARSEQHNAAFLVGKVSGLTKVDHRNNRDRYRVDLKEYALVTVSGFRHGAVRNPVTYSDTDQCKRNGLDIAALKFKPMPHRHEEHIRQLNAERGLSIAEAKEGLAIYFNVPPENIKITIVS